MPRTDNIEAILDSIPSDAPAVDGGPWRRIVKARKQIEKADTELREAVAAARDAGYSWTTIGAALDTTRQAAFQRYGRNS